MKHCQITGVEMPDEKKARDEAANLELGDHCWPFIRGWDACAAYRDASPNIHHAYKSEIYAKSISNLEMADNANDSIADFPEKEFELWFNTPLPDRSCRTICEYWFGRGRADRQWKVLVEQLRKRTFERDQLEAKLAEAQAEIERLKNGK